MIRYCVTIFLSAFLLFQIQPMIARFILPWFGGTAAVWTTCLMFFQSALLLGYLYAHLLRRLLSPRAGWAVHVAVLLVAAWMTSVPPAVSWQPEGDSNLTLAIVGLLAVSIGFPFVALSSTGPLIQAWQSQSHSDQSPYRLYALSNLGSMLALVTYPFLVEIYVPLATQAAIWSWGFIVFAICSAVSGYQTIGWNSWNQSLAVSAQPTREMPFAFDAWRVIKWIVLAMAATIVLLATTNLMCQEVASVPFLWILPLSLYLLSFIICFDRPGLYRRRVFIALLIVTTFLSITVVHLNVLAGLLLQIAGLSGVCFAASMICHGELERSKPSAEKLTTFYLSISVGGALGGMFVCMVAPHWFVGFYEFHLGLLICLLVAFLTVVPFWKKRPPVGGEKWSNGVLAVGVFTAIAFVLCSLMYFVDPSYHPGVVFRGRNEYGLVSVIDRDQYRRFINGRIEHGGQSLKPGSELGHNSYYVPGSGAAVAFESYRESHPDPLEVGVLGLGAGAMATWLEPKDQCVFYEINPMVEMIADKYFSFLEKSPGDCSVVLGDGRIRLQQQLSKTGSANFDLLFMDAFASDSIPVHLLTSECFDLYCQHLKPNGILVAHITNRFIDLRPVIFQHALDRDMTPILIEFQSPDRKLETRWVLMTHNKNIIDSTTVQQNQNDWPIGLSPIRWTDDYASLASVLDWSANVDWKKMEQNLEELKQISSESTTTPPQDQPRE